MKNDNGYLPSFICHHSSVIIHLSSFICHHSSVIIHLPSFICHHSSTRRPIHLTTSEQVDMQVRHGLAAFLTVVDNDAEALL